MVVRQFIVVSFIAVLSLIVTQSKADNCNVIEESNPPFEVVNSNGALNRNSTMGQPHPVFFPKGTIVKVDPTVWGRIPFTTIRYQSLFSFMPSVKVLSVPDVAPNMQLSNGGQSVTFDKANGGIGQRAYVGMVANINGGDLKPVFLSGKETADVDTPANVIFEVRRDVNGAIDPSLRGRAIKLDYDSASQTFAVKRCCPGNIPSQYGLRPGSRYPTELDRNESCTYMPVFDVLRPIDTGAGRPLSYSIERRIAATDCDPLMAALSPVEQQNQRAAFMLSRVLNEPDAQSLERLQRVAWQNATRSRTKSSDCGGGTVVGNSAKCMCKAGVNDTLTQSGWTQTRIPGENAIDAVSSLPRMGFTNVISQVHTAEEAPPGAILVYRNTRGGSGHIEIKVDSQTYCSDFCKNSPINYYIPTRQLVGIFLKRT